MKTRTNFICAKCELANMAVNGRFYTVLKTYVEYARNPLCSTTKK